MTSRLGRAIATMTLKSVKGEMCIVVGVGMLGANMIKRKNGSKTKTNLFCTLELEKV